MSSIRGYYNNTPDVSWWLDQLREGIEWRKQCTHQVSWDKWRKYYRNEFGPGVLPVNLFFRMLRTVVPRIYFRDPSLSVIATKSGIEQQVFAQLIERVDNKLVRTMDMKSQMKRIIHNTWMFGTGAGKLGYGAEYTPTPSAFETSAPESGSINLRRRVEFNSSVKPNMPWFMSVHPGNLIVPKGLMQFTETPWVAMWIRRSMDDVQADSRLKHVKNLHASSGSGFGSLTNVTSMKSNQKDEIDLVEIRDMRTGKVLVIAPYSSDRVLYFDDDELQNNNRPNIYPVVFNPDDERFWGVPDSAILEPQQHEINEIRTLQMKHRRISLVKLFYKKQSIDIAELEKMLNGDVGAAIAINGDLSDFEVKEMGGVPDSLYAASAEVQADVRDSMGFSRNQAGEYASQKSHNAPTAVEARIVQASSEIRVDERRDSIADMLVRVFEDTNALCFSKWEDDQVIQVMGPDAMPTWVAFKPNMLKAAQYELRIEPDNQIPETRDMREQKAIGVYNLLKSNPLIDPTLLTASMLREIQGFTYDELARNMQQLRQNAAVGTPGATMQNPVSSPQFMQMLAQGGQ